MKKILIYTFIFFAFIFSEAKENKTQKIYLFYTNDLQGGIGKQRATFMNPNFPPILGGGASAAGIIKKYRAKAAQNGDVVLLLDAGDIFYSSRPIGKASKGLAIIDYMNAIGYEAMAPGNHDFDFGKEAFINLAKKAQFPVLAANLFTAQDKAHPAPVKACTVIQRRGLRIGLFGLASKSSEQNDDPKVLQGFIFADEIPAARRAVATLKKEKADLIIALAHLGLPYDAQEGYTLLTRSDAQNIEKRSYVNAMELAHYVSGIDVLVSGRIHRGYAEPWEDPLNHTLCVQNYPNGGNLGLLVLNVDRQSKEIIGYDLPSKDGGLLLLSEDEFWPEENMARKIKSLQDKYEKGFDDIIGLTRQTIYRSSRGESPMGDLMCDAMLEVSEADFVFNNYTGMRLDLPIGAITPRDVANVFPFGNEIVVISMKGALLKSLLEGSVRGSYAGLAIAGGKVVYQKDLPDGSKITTFEVQGAALDPQKIYRVATTEYLAEGNYGMNALAFLPEENFHFTGTTVREAVVSYIKNYTPLSIEIDGRWKSK